MGESQSVNFCTVIYLFFCERKDNNSAAQNVILWDS